MVWSFVLQLATSKYILGLTKRQISGTYTPEETSNNTLCCYVLRGSGIINETMVKTFNTPVKGTAIFMKGLKIMYVYKFTVFLCIYIYIHADVIHFKTSAFLESSSSENCSCLAVLLIQQLEYFLNHRP